MTSLSDDQSKALDQMLDWYGGLPRTWIHCHGSSDCPSHPHTHGNGQPAPVYSLGGLAGTGKTTLMEALDTALEGEAVFGTPTHKASEVLRGKLPGKKAERVRTYHSLAYETTPNYRCTVTRGFVSAVRDKCVCGQKDACECPMHFLPCGSGAAHTCHVTAELRIEPRVHLGGHRDLIIIDESSMLSEQHVRDIRRFGVPILLVGDRGQLPPIKDPMNHWTLNPDVELTQIHRQGADSGVLQAAYDVRFNGILSQASYGGGEAIRMRPKDPRTQALLERFDPGGDGALITYTNRLRAVFNRVYHERRVGSALVDAGDRVVALGGRPYEVARVVLDNGVPRATGEFLHVHNGMTGTVLKAAHRNLVSELTVQLDNHRLATPGNPVVVLTGPIPTAQFGEERELPLNSPKRPKGSHVWDYAYALTAHKAQGSEFKHVIVADQKPPEYRQWMYTALTRAREAVVVIDWKG